MYAEVRFKSLVQANAERAKMLLEKNSAVCLSAATKSTATSRTDLSKQNRAQIRRAALSRRPFSVLKDGRAQY